jgi:hypothetical protein
MNTFWAIVANAMVIGGAVAGGLLFFLYVSWVPTNSSRARRIH